MSTRDIAWLIWALTSASLLAVSGVIVFKRLRHWFRKTVSTRRALRKIPAGATVHWRTRLKRTCRRCGVGTVVKYYRYQLLGQPSGHRELAEITSLFRCTKCTYRGVALRKKRASNKEKSKQTQGS